MRLHLRCAAMPPKQMSESSGFSLAAWMLPKPTADGVEQQNAEHKKTDDQTPSPTEVVDSSQKTPSPTEVVHSPAVDYETYFMQNGACSPTNGNDGSDDGSDDDFDDLATDEAAAITELMAQAAAQNVTMQVLVTNKRPRTEPEPTEPAAPEEADFVH